MDVITTHVNADFDCVGSMVAAKKLYPDALLVFSGSQEKGVRDFFVKFPAVAAEFTRLKDLDVNEVDRLIVVDCQHSSRLAKLADVVRRGVEVHVYDHHPKAGGDLDPSGGSVRTCGSSTTILVSLLKERRVTVTPQEATVMMLGIYEDTGNLTFPCTTTEDYAAAAWLLERGANLNEVADSISRELTVEQVSLLNDLLKSMKTTTLKGVDVSIAHASLDRYVGDVAGLAHMMRDMENLNALFLVVGMGDRIYVVARSRVPEVRVGEILEEMGGGGHATAASATVKGLTLIQTLELLDAILRRRVNPRRTARDIMSSPVKTLPAETTIEEARELLVRYNVSAMPVLDDSGHVKGIITRKTVEKAMYHNLGGAAVTEYMHTEYMTAEPDTPISDIQAYIVGRDARLVPVVADAELVGVVTRTDLMRYGYGGEALYDLAREPLPVRSREVVGLMNKHLPARTVGVLRDLGLVGDRLDLPVYAVGGFVRDLLLGVSNKDVDVTVEGDGILFADTFAAQFGCRVKSHQKFGTAVIVFPSGLKIDVASTRLEYYVSPGALPTVERSSLKMDLYRRDFTVNTLAIRLNSAYFGRLIDFFGANRDLQDGVIRVLHNLSFVEDPTRVFRAIRFEQRLSFRIAKHTENLIKNAVKMDFLDKLGGRRLLSELVHILKEKEPLNGIYRMASLGLFRFIHPDLEFNASVQAVLEGVRDILSWFDLLFLDRPYERWAVYFLAICDPLTDDQFWGTCTRLSVAEHYRSKLFEMRKDGGVLLNSMERRLQGRGKLENSEIYFFLRTLSVEVLLYLMARTRSDEVKRAISLYFTKLSGVRPLIDGEDLMRLGVPRGPRYRELLDAALSARLDGTVVSKEDELRLVRELAAV